jgi:acyl-CoA reductase-like NAD-dependent aldehyde dehydrogenase
MDLTGPGILETTRDGDTSVFPMFHSGGWHDAASGRRLPVLDPATGERLGCIPDAGEADVQAAYRAAAEAQRSWAASTATERAERLRDMANRIETHADWLASLESRTSGNPVTAMRRDVVKGAEIFRHMAGLGYLLTGDTVPVVNGALHYTKREPFGVVGRIVAFNHPFLFACGRVSTALVAGNAVILKPSELTSVSALALAALTADCLPAGLFSVLTGGGELGAALTQHPEIQRISFTGSAGTALKIIAQGAASGSVKNMTFELGGKNPMIVFPDADLDRAAAAAVRGMNFAAVQGQSCGSTSRLYVHKSIEQEMRQRVVEHTSALRVGLPTDEKTDVGCLISPAARDRCLDFINDAVNDGAVIDFGGGVPDDPALAGGGFLEPTVLAEVPDTARAAREEIFGPVLSTFTWDDWDDVIARANGLAYGLTAAVWTRDLDQAFRTADALQAGYVWINEVERRHYGIAFGGWKNSGVGVEYGLDEALSLTRIKTYVANYGGLG